MRRPGDDDPMPESARRLEAAMGAAGLLGGRSNPGPDTAEAMRARLRGFLVTVGGDRAALEARLAAIEAARARWGADPSPIAALTVPQLHRELDAVGIDMPRGRKKSSLVGALARIATMDDPSPRGPRTPPRDRWVVTWTNPATLMRETFGAETTAEGASRLAAAASARALELTTGAAWLPEFGREEFAGEAAAARRQRTAEGAYEPRGTDAEDRAGRLLRDAVRINHATMGPALSGDRGEVARLGSELERTLRGLEAARREVWAERGVPDPRDRAA